MWYFLFICTATLFLKKEEKKEKKGKKVMSHKILWDIAIKIKFYGTLPKNMGFMGLSSKYGTKIKFYGTWQVWCTIQTILNQTRPDQTEPYQIIPNILKSSITLLFFNPLPFWKKADILMFPKWYDTSKLDQRFKSYRTFKN